MGTKEHGEVLEMAMNRMAQDPASLGKIGVQVSVRKETGKTHSQFGTQVKVSPNSVQVLGMGQWGAFLASPSGTDWQLYVIRKQAGNEGGVGPEVGPGG